jgi:ribonuclease P protein component
LRKKLKGKKIIYQLFLERRRLVYKPLQLQFTKVKNENTKMGVSVPKKKVALAVNRNRLKRQMREAIKHNSEIDKLQNNYHMMWIYIGKSSSCNFKEICKSMEHIIDKIKDYEKK